MSCLHKQIVVSAPILRPVNRAAALMRCGPWLRRRGGRQTTNNAVSAARGAGDAAPLAVGACRSVGEQPFFRCCSRVRGKWGPIGVFEPKFSVPSSPYCLARMLGIDRFLNGPASDHTAEISVWYTPTGGWDACT